jgi:cytoskeleton protein RodZ
MNVGNSMSDQVPTSAAASPVHEGGKVAGEMLRQAREAQGVHIAALAVSVKVQQRKLEALEAGRLDELPDATFTRALAQTVCRHLHIDPKPVLERLPQAGYGPRLEQVAQGLNEPFRSHGGLPSLGSDWSSTLRPAVLLPALLVLGAVAVFFWPKSKTPGLEREMAVASAVVEMAAPAASPVAQGLGLVVDPAVAASAGASGAAVDAVVYAAPLVASTVLGASQPGTAEQGSTAGPIVIRTTEKSWVEVKDGNGKTIVARALPSGETLSVDGAPPFKVKIGNANTAQLSYRGQPVDLLPSSRGNVARLELK